MDKQQPQDCPNLTHPDPERRRCPLYDTATIMSIATQAANLAIAEMEQRTYIAIGRSVVAKSFYIIGVLALAFWTYLRTGAGPLIK